MGNWLLNKYRVGNEVLQYNITFRELQYAIWKLIDTKILFNSILGVNETVGDHLYDKALNDGDDYEPDCHEYLAVLLVVDNDEDPTKIDKQVIIVLVPPPHPCICSDVPSSA